MIETFKIVDIKVLNDYLLLVTFENKEVRVFDMKPYIDYGPVFRPLKDYDKFKDFIIEYGCIEWSSGASLHYDTVYIKSYPCANEIS